MQANVRCKCPRNHAFPSDKQFDCVLILLNGLFNKPQRPQSFTPNGSCRKLPGAKTAARLTVQPILNMLKPEPWKFTFFFCENGAFNLDKLKYINKLIFIWI